MIKKSLCKSLDRTARIALTALLVLFAGATASAHSGGVSGYSGKTGSTCTQCHSTGSGITVAIAGPASVASGSTVSYTLTNSGNPLGGLDVAVTAGSLAAGQGTKVNSSEITQTAALATSPLSWTFNWTAPTVSTSTTVTMYGASIADGYSGETGTTTKTITVTPAAPASGPSFQLSLPATVTAHVGQPVTLPVTIASSGGFSGPVTLSISGLPTGVTAAWSANPMTIIANGTATANATFTVNAVSATLSPLRRPAVRPLLALSLPFVGILFGSVVLTNPRKARRRGFWLALGLVLLIGLLMVGCGGSKGSPTSTTQSPASSASTGSAPSAPAPAPQSFMVTVTGTSGSIQQSGTVSVTVN